MTLNDAIIDYEKMAKHQEWLKKQNTNRGGTEYIKMSCLNDKKAQEYFQLAEWLKELKAYREIIEQWKHESHM